MAPRQRVSVALWLAVTIAAVAGRAAGAEPPTPADVRAAEALFRSGREALKRGDHDLACARFSESHRLAPDEVGPLLNISQCEARQGRILRAIAYAERSLGGLEETDPRRAIAVDALRELRPRVAQLEATLPAPDATLVIDGTPVEVRGQHVIVPLDPGKHGLTVHVTGFKDLHSVEAFADGESRKIALARGAPSSQSPARLVPPRTQDERRRRERSRRSVSSSEPRGSDSSASARFPACSLSTVPEPFAITVHPMARATSSACRQGTRRTPSRR